MDASDFHRSLTGQEPPAGLSHSLVALWWDGQDDWVRAHQAVMVDESSPDAAWVHAYLHRKEGDAGNASYWYARAGRPASQQALRDEWGTIVLALLDRH